MCSAHSTRRLRRMSFLVEAVLHLRTTPFFAITYTSIVTCIPLSEGAAQNRKSSMTSMIGYTLMEGGFCNAAMPRRRKEQGYGIKPQGSRHLRRFNKCFEMRRKRTTICKHRFETSTMQQQHKNVKKICWEVTKQTLRAPNANLVHTMHSVGQIDYMPALHETTTSNSFPL